MASDLPACKYGAQCKRKNPQHFKQFSHPGDEEEEKTPQAGSKRLHSVANDDDDATQPMPLKKAKFAVEEEDDDTENLNAGSVDDDSAAAQPPPPRRACKYGAGCYRREKAHKAQFAHPGDADYQSSEEEFSSSSSEEDVDEGVEWAPTKQKRRRRKKAAVSPKKPASPKRSKATAAAAPSAAVKAAAFTASTSGDEETSVDGKQMCPFGAECLRTSKHHRQQFSHPSAPVVAPAIVAKKAAGKQTVDNDDEDSDEDEDGGSALKGQVICQTGALSVTRREFTRLILMNSGKCSSSVTGKTTLLVADAAAEGTSKWNKATAMEVPIVSEQYIRDVIAGKASISKPRLIGQDPEEAEEEEEECDINAVEDSVLAAPPSAAEFSDDEEVASVADTHVVCGVTPKTIMKKGQEIEVQSKTSSSKYRVKRVGNHYYCTCVSWRQQRLAVDARTCKHLKEVLGDAFELARVGAGGFDIQNARNTNEPREVPNVMLAFKWEPASVDPTGWWMSEKLDGVRAYWNGKRLLSRNGNSFPAPEWFTDALPDDMHLDGELWCGRGQFQIAVSIARTEGSDEWKKVAYHVFDAPKVEEGFEGRVKATKRYFKANPCGHVKVVSQAKCKSHDHIKELMDSILANKGEGLMLRKPASSYTSGRSSSLLKVKRFYDAEAVVLGYVDGKGKYKGLVGSLDCKMASGKKFRVGSGLSDTQRAKPPAVGSIITYRFQELTDDGVPRFPSFVGLRIDLDEPSDAVLPAAPAPAIPF
mmetsp:Transcript_21865/g.85686  ORF Transcript_21865/g.85686 Transcript_21865/m.85686 type:complete len:758 (-) Transcript_21865:2367-4640(-)